MASKAHTAVRDAAEEPVADLKQGEEDRPCALLELPAELRNRIFEYAILTDDRILIDPTYKQPGLLQTNRQIRHETKRMYWLENNFRIRIYDHDSRLLGKFMKHQVRRAMMVNSESGQAVFLPVAEQNKFSMDLPVQISYHWANLVRWCRSVYNLEDMMCLHSKGSYGNLQIVSAAHEIALTREISWERCLELLGALRKVAGMANAEWLKDQ